MYNHYQQIVKVIFLSILYCGCIPTITFGESLLVGLLFRPVARNAPERPSIDDGKDKRPIDGTPPIRGASGSTDVINDDPRGTPAIGTGADVDQDPAVDNDIKTPIAVDDSETTGDQEPHDNEKPADSDGGGDGDATTDGGFLRPFLPPQIIDDSSKQKDTENNDSDMTNDEPVDKVTGEKEEENEEGTQDEEPPEEEEEEVVEEEGTTEEEEEEEVVDEEVPQDGEADKETDEDLESDPLIGSPTTSKVDLFVAADIHNDIFMNIHDNTAMGGSMMLTGSLYSDGDALLDAWASAPTGHVIGISTMSCQTTMVTPDDPFTIAAHSCLITNTLYDNRNKKPSILTMQAGGFYRYTVDNDQYNNDNLPPVFTAVIVGGSGQFANVQGTVDIQFLRRDGFTVVRQLFTISQHQVS